MICKKFPPFRCVFRKLFTSSSKRPELEMISDGCSTEPFISGNVLQNDVNSIADISLGHVCPNLQAAKRQRGNTMKHRHGWVLVLSGP